MFPSNKKSVERGDKDNNASYVVYICICKSVAMFSQVSLT